MRKIEKALIDAIKANTAFARDNTAFNPQAGQVFLHGNLIATVSTDPNTPVNLGQKGDRVFAFTLAGWNTPTTRSRINALSREFLGYTIVANRAHVPHVFLDRDDKKGEPIHSGQWFV